MGGKSSGTKLVEEPSMDEYSKCKGPEADVHKEGSQCGREQEGEQQKLEFLIISAL